MLGVTDIEGLHLADEAIIAGGEINIILVLAEIQQGIALPGRAGKLAGILRVIFFVENSSDERIALIIGVAGALLKINAADFKAAQANSFAAAADRSFCAAQGAFRSQPPHRGADSDTERRSRACCIYFPTYIYAIIIVAIFPLIWYTDSII